jgi:polyketide synthase PksM
LQRKTQDLLERLRKLEPLDLQALAYTLQVGREAMDERVAFVVESLDAPSFKNAFHGQAKRGRETGTVVTDYTDLSKVAEAWVNGAKVDWARLYGASRPKRISLPTYPFARERYWRERADAAQSVLHPLVQQNVSGIHQQCYRSTFSGGELFLTEQRTLPAMAFLEMARVAVESAANAKGRALELFNIVWADAVTIKDRTPIEIALFANGPDELAYEIYSPTHDVVHFQGHAFLGRKLAPEKVDTRNLKPLALGAAPDGYVLPPHLLAATGHAQLPLALESLRILRPCSQHMFFWSRSSAGERSQLDIDVCDGDGNVCIQLRGVTFESEGVALTEPRSAAFTARASSKPTGISLA